MHAYANSDANAFELADGGLRDHSLDRLERLGCRFGKGKVAGPPPDLRPRGYTR